MRAVIQRVTRASVCVGDETVGQIGPGIVALLGVEDGDTQTDREFICQKIANLRIFNDEDGKMNLSLKDVGGEILLVSQFTLLGDARKGRRPGFTAAARPEVANEMYEQACEALEQEGFTVQRGRFQTDMQVELVNDGPVTILLDSRKKF